MDVLHEISCVSSLSVSCLWMSLQNIGALQALVPLLATQGGVEQPQQQLQPQQQQQQQPPQQLMPMNAAAPGIVSAISQLATATASLLPQLSAVGQAQAAAQQGGQTLAMLGQHGLALSTPGPVKEPHRSPHSQQQQQQHRQQQPQHASGLTMSFEPMGQTQSLTHTPKGEEAQVERDVSSPQDGDDGDDASPGDGDEEPIAGTSFPSDSFPTLLGTFILLWDVLPACTSLNTA